MASTAPLHLRVIAPSSPFARADLEEGVRRLRQRYRVSYDEAMFARTGFLAGDDKRRLAELRGALQDADVDVIVAARGGYGATRLLQQLSASEVREHRKPLVGFSDITALHALWARAGVAAVHGPMVAALGRAEEPSVARWCATIEGAVPSAFAGTPLAPGRATGPVVGGNLAVLAALLGSSHVPPLDGAILLLEDVGEAPYRVDRMLTSLRAAGWFERVAGVALGSFSRCGAGADGVEVSRVLAERLTGLGVPVVGDLALGHGANDREIVLGARAQLDGGGGFLTPIEGLAAARSKSATGASSVAGTESKKA